MTGPASDPDEEAMLGKLDTVKWDMLDERCSSGISLRRSTIAQDPGLIDRISRAYDRRMGR